MRLKKGIEKEFVITDVSFFGLVGDSLIECPKCHKTFTQRINYSKTEQFCCPFCNEEMCENE